MPKPAEITVEQIALEAMLDALLEIVTAEAAEVRDLPVSGPLIAFPTIV